MSRSAYVACFAAPLFAAVAIIVLSPNYARRPESMIREGPIGGDFLQEWIGGHIVASGHTEKIYDAAFTQQLQHDSSLLGFRWAENEYYPMVYPPFYYRLVSPLSHLSLNHAATIWCLLNALAFSIGLTLLAISLRDALRNYVWLVVAGGLFYPLLLSLNMGQKSGFLFLLLVAAFNLARQGRSFWSGVAFGFIVFKPHLALVIGPAMLLKRQYSFALGAMIPMGVAATSSLLMGFDVCGEFLGICLSVGRYSEHVGYSLVDAQNLWGAAQFAFNDWAPALGIIVASMSACAVIGLIVWSLRGEIKIQSDKFRLQFSALVVGTILLSPHFFTYDLSILLVPLLLVAGYFANRMSDAKQCGSHLDIGRAPWHWAFIGVFFGASGLFRPLAETTGVPISVLLLGGWLVLLTWEVNSMTTSPEPISDGDEREIRIRECLPHVAVKV